MSWLRGAGASQPQPRNLRGSLAHSLRLGTWADDRSAALRLSTIPPPPSFSQDWEKDGGSRLVRKQSKLFEHKLFTSGCFGEGGAHWELSADRERGFRWGFGLQVGGFQQSGGKLDGGALASGLKACRLGGGNLDGSFLGAFEGPVRL